MSAPDCPACAGRWPSARLRVVDLDLTTAYLHDDQFFPGWTVLVLKRHATELFELTSTDRGRLVDEVAEVARALPPAILAARIADIRARLGS